MRCAPFGSIEPDVLSKVQGMSCVLRDVCYFENMVSVSICLLDLL